MVTPADFAAFQQQLRQEVADVTQQPRAEVNEAISGRYGHVEQYQLQRSRTNQPDQQSPSHIESVTSFRETGKAAMKSESSGALCRTLALGDASMVKIKDSRCLPGSRASPSLTTMRLRLIAETMSSDQLRHRLYQFLHRTTANEPLRVVQQTR